jgi:hypothetical protein
MISSMELWINVALSVLCDVDAVKPDAEVSAAGFCGADAVVSNEVSLLEVVVVSTSVMMLPVENSVDESPVPSAELY